MGNAGKHCADRYGGLLRAEHAARATPSGLEEQGVAAVCDRATLMAGAR